MNHQGEKQGVGTRGPVELKNARNRLAALWKPLELNRLRPKSHAGHPDEYGYLVSAGKGSRLGCTGRHPRRPERVFGEAPNTAHEARALPGRLTHINTGVLPRK